MRIMSSVFRSRIALFLCGLSVPSMFVSLPSAAQDAAAAPEGFSPVQALQIVDCLLPGQVRVLGGRTYLTPRRPARTTAQDCAARGGEYLAYDRASYESALRVWLPAAEEGDPEAQTIVGEIYERGLGDEPDYGAAAQWYRRAAEQDYARAQFNLGTLYEEGLGVDADGLAALNWYRRASGLAEDSLIFRSAAAVEQAALRSELLEQIEQRDRQIEVLTREIESLNERLRSRADDAAGARTELESIRALLERLESERRADRARLDSMAAVQAVAEPVRTFGQARRVQYERRDFGRFYALMIGVQDYDLLDDLVSPANDIARLARLLEDRYGFSVITLADPDQLSVMRAINQLNETLEENDNLLIYFSGHGSRLQSGSRETGYWLPRNAEPSPDDTLWVPNEFVSRHLGRISAQRVLIVSDSCYSGLLGDEPGYVMVGDGRYTDEYIEWKMPKRSRLVLSSGADMPVVEEPDREHSVFARALLEALGANDRVLTAPELFLRMRQYVRRIGSGLAPIPDPELKALKNAGHEVGDFFFIPAQS
jgi:regulator of replication initiation timing